MTAAEFKPGYVVVRHLIHSSNLEEPPAPMGALKAKQAPQPSIELINVLEQPPHSVEQPDSDLEH